MFQDNNVKMFPASIAILFQNSNALMYQDNSVPLFLDNIVGNNVSPLLGVKFVDDLQYVKNKIMIIHPPMWKIPLRALPSTLPLS